jgi:hypothetical protein
MKEGKSRKLDILEKKSRTYEEDFQSLQLRHVTHHHVDGRRFGTPDFPRCEGQHSNLLGGKSTSGCSRKGLLI